MTRIKASTFLPLLLLVMLTRVINCNREIKVGPKVVATRGEPWPMPQNRILEDKYYYIEAAFFKFEITVRSCDILKLAVERYRQILIHEFHLAEKYGQCAADDNDVSNDVSGSVSGLEVDMRRKCEPYPPLESDEYYWLEVPNTKYNNETIRLTSNTVWGIIRGLETFTQLITHSKDGKGLIIRGQYIFDTPRFPHRGLLLDTSRHFIPLPDILLTLDAMSYNKLNVFHWHIVDDNSFPYVSEALPELSAKGAYHHTMVYTPEDVQKVIEYARLRGIRVVPEFDTPGHTKSWGSTYLTSCYDSKNQPTGEYNAMDPTNQELYVLLKTLLTEVASKFPDKYIHLGGDDVEFCLNPKINEYMKLKNIRNVNELEGVFIKQVLEMVAKLGSNPIVWQDVFDKGIQLSNGTIVQVRKGAWQMGLFRVTEAGYPALLSACWNLDSIGSGIDWLKYYRCEPLSFHRSNKQKKLVLGGEACMWGEFVDTDNLHTRIWPGASATAEILWSQGAKDEKIAAQRLEEHTCRMRRRGVPVQPPNGAGFCLT